MNHNGPVFSLIHSKVWVSVPRYPTIWLWTSPTLETTETYAHTVFRHRRPFRYARVIYLELSRFVMYNANDY